MFFFIVFDIVIVVSGLWDYIQDHYYSHQHNISSNNSNNSSEELLKYADLLACLDQVNQPTTTIANANDVLYNVHAM